MFLGHAHTLIGGRKEKEKEQKRKGLSYFVAMEITMLFAAYSTLLCHYGIWEHG